ncbi:MAG: hypothetical protein LBD27_07385 [Tannerella sp.]|jgi:hypothetical protein|nr:hypothetical protein [Tannerella sp.]
MDWMASLFLLVFYVFFVVTGKKRVSREIPALTLVFLFYLCYSLYVSYNSQYAASLDFLTQIRPYAAFFIVSQMALPFSEQQKKWLKRICLCIWPFFIPVGIYGLVNSTAFDTIMGHETNFVSVVVCLSLVYLYCSDFTLKERFTFVFMLTTGLIAVHTGFYVFFLLAVGLLFCFRDATIFRRNWRTGISLFVAFACMLYIVTSQIAATLLLPDVNGGASDFTTRSVLYHTAIEMLRDFFPFGSGFASFATDASGACYSQIYAVYGLNAIDGLRPENCTAVSGSYYPSLAQFGIAGILLYLFFWVFVISGALLRFRQERNIRLFVLVLMLAGFIFIENVTDSFFTSNKGFFLMMFFGLLTGKPDMPDVQPSAIPVRDDSASVTALPPEGVVEAGNEAPEAAVEQKVDETAEMAAKTYSFGDMPLKEDFLLSDFADELPAFEPLPDEEDETDGNRYECMS